MKIEIYGVEGESIDPKHFAEFERAMKEEVIPSIVKALQLREDAKWSAFINGQILY